MGNKFSFGNVSSTTSKKALSLQAVENCVAINHPGPGEYVLILLDEKYTPSELRVMEAFFESNGIKNYKACFALNVEASKEYVVEVLKEGLIDFYKTNKSSFDKYLEPGCKIVTVGAALYSFTKSDDVRLDYLYDVVTNRDRTSFFCKGHIVYPIDSFRDIYHFGMTKTPANTYKTSFALYQMKALMSEKKQIPDDKVNLHKIETKEQFNEFFEQHKDIKNQYVAWDLETGGFDFTKDKIICISISFNGIDGYFIPWNLIDKRKLSILLANNKQIGANLKFDIKFLWREGIKSARVDEDVVSLGHSLNENSSCSLKTLAYYFSAHGGYEDDLEDYKKKIKITSYAEIPEHILWPYATMDAIVTYQIFFRMLEALREFDKEFPNEKSETWTLEKYYRDLMIRANNVFARIEFDGIYISTKKLAEKRSYFNAKIAEVEEELRNSFNVGKTFDFNSLDDLGRLLESKGWEDLGRNKKGLYNTGDFQISRWEKTHEEAKKIRLLRSLKTMVSSFIGPYEHGDTGWPQYIRVHNDGSERMHAIYYVMLADTGRTKCDSPNLQNIPAHGKLADEIKKCFCTPNDEEYLIAAVDFASLQVRLAAIDGQDSNIYRIYTDPALGADLHSYTAHSIFCANKEFDIDIITVEDEKGNKHEFFGGQKVLTKRGECFARELTETDELL